jgi:hypothetical protein
MFRSSWVDGRTLILSRYTEPDIDQKLLFEQLKLTYSIFFPQKDKPSSGRHGRLTQSSGSTPRRGSSPIDPPVTVPPPSTSPGTLAWSDPGKEGRFTSA